MMHGPKSVKKLKFGIGDFIKIGRKIPNLVKIGEKCRALYMKT